MHYLYKLAMAGMLILSTSFANATIIVSYYEDGADLTFDWSGSWDTSGSSGSSSYINLFIGSSGLADDFYGFTNGYSRIANNITYTQTVGSGIFAFDFGQLYGSGSGDTFAIDWISQTNVFLYAPVGYIAGQNISGSLTVANTTIADLGLGHASFDFGNYGEVHFRRASAVPEPSIFVLLGLGLLGLSFARKRKT